jgi:CelD/BcsL family acetyltransferase involved in cellulose biosynthesis
VPDTPEARLLSLRDITDDVELAWRDLAERAAEPNPCNEVDFALPAMRHLPMGERARLLVVTRGRRLDACLPVLAHRRWRRQVPVPALVSWTHDYQLLGTPLVDRQRATPTLLAMLKAPWRERAGALLLEIEDLGDGGPVAAALDEASAALAGRPPRRWNTYERAVLRRTGIGAVPGRSGRHKSARRARRALERDAGPVTSTDRAGDPDAVDRFLALEAGGWKGRAGTALSCDPAAAAFFRDVCRRFAAEGRLEMRSLEVAAGPVAMDTVLRAGEGAFHLKTAYDERYSSYSPGVQLLIDIADRFAAEDVRFRDSCTAAASAAESHAWPGRRRMSTVVLPFASAASRAIVTAVAAARDRRRPADRP